jgi:predicted P-loop ATPase
VSESDLEMPNVVALPRKPRRKAPYAPPWLKNTIADERGRILPVVANILVALRAAPELAEAFSYDEMQACTIVDSALPLAEGAEPASDDPMPRPLRDIDVTQVQEWLQWQGMPKIGRETTHQAISKRAQERAFNPVRDYLDALVWDGVARLDKWTSYYLGADPSAYNSATGRMALLGAVARIYKPGCKLDYAIVLEGAQGVGKSRACKALGGKYFSDSLHDISQGKDAAQHLRGKWFVEISELAAIGRAEAEALKAFISRPEERYRPPYGREEVHEPRRCIFIATTNRHAYLKDETGGRRFWPVRVGSIDIPSLEHDRDQLFAEAVHRYRAHEQWWPDEQFEAEHIRPQQEQRFETDAWEDAIATYVQPWSQVRILDIASEALNIGKEKLGTSEQRRIISILTKLGFAPGKKDKYGRPYIRVTQ